ncbi:MAG: efflux RND transporter periplasmic adaptor subunit [Nannocystis sp.]|nr:efflux RND transporter periplasmic adaptor subunit [Nannocystis sp.]MBA3545899.1 efflux RND transporter periplasmic adaptor subunit [Nannocystis sp.]
MTTLPLPRLLLALTLLAACDGGEEKKSGLPPARPATGVPTIPGPPPKPGASATSPGSPAQVASSANRFVATALPKHSAELGPKMSGTLTAVMVEEGEKVKKGQQLFRLDARTTRLGVTQAETMLEGAVIARDNAQRELERQRVLAEKGTISPAVLERAEAAFNSATNGISAAEVAVSMARRTTNDSAVTSPIDGVVARKLKSVGETVTMMPPTTVLVVQDQSVIELRARIPETTLKHVKEGELITAHFSAVEVTRPARVVRIQPTVDPQTRTIEIVADVDNADNLLRPGMYVEVELAPPAATPAVAAAPAVPPDTKSPVASVKRKPAAAKETP